MPHSDRHLVVGVVGHVDHGKTTLVRALTGIETDRLAEEKRRGISIALGFAHLALSGVTVDLVDMPGHERFIRTLVAGATGIDAALVVVAADDGVMPQTLEHLDIISLLGIRRGIVAIAKSDLGQAGDLAAVTAAFCRERGVDVPPPIEVSALSGAGLLVLREALGGLVTDAAARRDLGAPFLPVDRAFSMPGHGTVVTGTLRGGQLLPGQTLSLFPGDTEVRVRALQTRGARVAAALPGQRVAVNLRGIDAGSVRTGATLSAPALLPPTTWLTVALRSTAAAPPLATGAALRLLLGTQELGARLRLLEADTLEPGSSTFAQLRCAEAVTMPGREPFILRLASPPRTVAGGLILDTAPIRLRRHDREALDRLAILRDADPATAATHEAEHAGIAGTTLRRLGALLGAGPAHVASLLDGAPVLVLPDGTVASRAASDALSREILSRLDAVPDPLGPNQLQAALSNAAPTLLAATLGQLQRGGHIVQDGAGFRRTGSRHAEADAVLARRIAAALQAAGLMPPDPASLAPDPASRRALAYLVRAGIAIRAADRVQKRELIFHRDSVAAAQRLLAPLLVPPGLKVTDAGAALGISRKYSVPLLEYLDSIHFTRRTTDRRTLASA